VRGSSSASLSAIVSLFPKEALSHAIVENECTSADYEFVISLNSWWQYTKRKRKAFVNDYFKNHKQEKWK
jgi:hypothetical protein